ncbi:MAG: YkgJ family cysteine cluster protein [Phycisphaerae bacterium]|nr:YkgJ family cysteine cluster protein [Phycisphaerae bacterium]
MPFHINVAVEKATLADIVPLARKLSTKLAIAFLAGLRGNGQSVPCCKGCCACCSYLIPLSVPEVFRLREELLEMPAENSSRIFQSCLDTAKRILDKKFRTSYLKSFSKSGQPRINQVSKWYGGLELACPFLSDGLCMLYEQRPFACREHIVTGSAVSCQTDHRDEPNVAPMPVSILEVLGQLTAELEQSDIEAVMLPLAFAWAQDNLQRAERTWPAVAMVKRFVEILKLTASKNSAAPVLST